MFRRTLSENDKKLVAYNQKWCCNTCNILLPNTYEIDHIVPHCLTGDDSFNNLQALCPNCHSQKTLKEQNRIYKFKKYCSTLDLNYIDVCWFCLEKNSNLHSCSNQMKDIVLTLPKEKKDITELDEFYYIKADNVLHINIGSEELWINNFFTNIEQENCTVEFICKSIRIATKRNKKKYDKIEITIDVGQEVPEELIEYFEENLPCNFKEIEIIDYDNLDISYICIEP